MGTAYHNNRLQPGARQPDAGARRAHPFTERKSTVADGERLVKTSGADIGTKVALIRFNRHKYCISAMCIVLKVSRSRVYYEPKTSKDETALEDAVQTAFEENRSLYGSRKLKRVLAKKGITLSRRRICRLMKRRGLEPAYTRKKYRNHNKKCNESSVPNLLDRQFHGQKRLAVVVSDLTYVRVGQRWNYVCILLDLHNREIIGYSSGTQKDALLVQAAFAKVKVNLAQIQMFHTDRGSEYDNELIDGLLDVFGINRSLSLKACPYDNAVAEATFKLIKTELIQRNIFGSAEHLALELADYVHWFNNIRIHGSLDYSTPSEFRQHTLSFLFN
jgi:transposase InsO family protein